MFVEKKTFKTQNIENNNNSKTYYRPSQRDCPGADFYYTGRTDDGTIVETSIINTRPSIESTASNSKSTDFESEPTWVSEPSHTRRKKPL